GADSGRVALGQSGGDRWQQLDGPVAPHRRGTAVGRILFATGRTGQRPARADGARGEARQRFHLQGGYVPADPRDDTGASVLLRCRRCGTGRGRHQIGPAVRPVSLYPERLAALPPARYRQGLAAPVGVPQVRPIAVAERADDGAVIAYAERLDLCTGRTE